MVVELQSLCPLSTIPTMSTPSVVLLKSVNTVALLMLLCLFEQH